MQQRWLKVLTLVAIAAGASAACERSEPLSSAAAPRMAVTSTTYTIGHYTMLTAAGNASQSKSTVINQYGGKMNFGANALQVPAGAVTGPTKFTFTLQTQPYMAAKLSAVAVVSVKNQWVETGPPVTHFYAPLTLTLSYAGTKEQIPDPTQLVTLWIESGKIMDVQKADADVKGKKLITLVDHFTDYSPAVPGPGACPPGSLMTCDPNN